MLLTSIKELVLFRCDEYHLVLGRNTPSLPRFGQRLSRLFLLNGVWLSLKQALCCAGSRSKLSPRGGPLAVESWGRYPRYGSAQWGPKDGRRIALLLTTWLLLTHFFCIHQLFIFRWVTSNLSICGENVLGLTGLLFVYVLVFGTRLLSR